MKEAFVDGVLLDGRQDMVPQKDRVVLVEDGKITGIVDKEDMEHIRTFRSLICKVHILCRDWSICMCI